MTRKKPLDLILSGLSWLSAFIVIGMLVYIIGFVLVKGVPHIKPSLFSMNYNSDNVSLMPAAIGALIITAMSLLIAVPFGIFAAIYLTEYAKRGNRIVSIVRTTTETLSGIPSIVYGLFGMLFFVEFMKMGYSLLAGAFTLAIMILPLIMRSTEEALKSVPDTFREGSFGLGAGKLRTVFKIVLPSAVPGILAGVILAIGRIVGETAALIYTAGTVAQVPQFYNAATGQFFWQQSVRTLSIHMYLLSSESLHTNEAYATAVVLLVVVISINALSGLVAKKIAKR